MITRRKIMAKKLFSVKSKITALALSVLLLIGTVPIQVSAAQTSSDVTLLNGMNKDADIKFVEFGNSDKQLAVMLVDDKGEEAYFRQLCQSIITDETSVSIPRSIKDDNTTDLQPFVYSQSESPSKNDIIITWTDADKKFDSNITAEEIAGSMRISIAVMNSESHDFPFGAYNISVGKNANEGNNVCYYKSRVTKLGDKILITWAVCKNVENNNGCFSIEGMYYNPTDNTFSTDTNEKDNNGKLLPMSFVKNRNYISDYSVADINGKTAVLFQEATEGTPRMAVEMYTSVINPEGTFPFTVKESDKNRDLNLAVSNTVTNLVPSGKYTSLVESSMPCLTYYCNGNLYTVSPANGTPEGWRTAPFLDVSETGDTKYSFIIKNNVVQYISALQLTPLKTNLKEVTYGGKTYTKTEDEKWIDKDGKTAELYQHDIRLYYKGADDNQMSLLPLPLLDTDENFITCMPSFVIDSKNRLATIWAYGKPSESYINLYHTIYSQENLLKANYRAVNEATARANALNKGDYSDFSAVENAINSVVYDKTYKEQTTVNAYADAIENAINSLTLRSADYTEVNAAISRANELDENLYKDFTAVENAINAVDRTKNFKEQTEVDDMARAINDAIAALEYKDADYSETDKAIAKANALNPDDYKDFSAVDSAVNAVVRGKNITEQSEVDAMAKAIEDAIAALQYKDADYTKVDVAIAKANALKKDEYKDFSGVEAAVNAVVRGKNITEQSEVDAMAQAIEDAIAALQYKDADYTKVDAAITKANALKKDEYKDFSAVEAAVNAVVRGKKITEQSEVDKMAKAIEDAIAALQYKDADYTKVDAAIAKANALKKDDYKDFSGVDTAVKAVIRGKNITEQSEVDKMAKAIEDAIAALKYKDADYTKVDAAIAKADALNKNDYKDFSGVEAAVKAVVRGKNITEQSEVDKMAKTIEDAIAALEKKPASTKPGTSDKSPLTGNTSNLALWISLLLASGGATLATTVASRKKKYNR